MLDFIYYPVSFILWCWHRLFGFLLGDSSALGWAVSVVLLVFTLRAVLLRPAIDQVRAMRRLQRFTPELNAIRKKYANDRQRQAAELQKFQRENGVNVLRGFLPMLVQLPVLLGLSRVLRGFTEYPDRPNYFFPNSDVRSYLDARLFGAHLGNAIFNTPSLSGPVADHSPWLWQVAPVAIPLMLITSIATHVNARLSMSRQPGADSAAGGQGALMRGMSLWIFPLGALVVGGALPIGILLYWVSNNIWTLAQQYLVFRRIDARERAEQARIEAAAKARRAAVTPKPGRRPRRSGRRIRR